MEDSEPEPEPELPAPCPRTPFRIFVEEQQRTLPKVMQDEKQNLLARQRWRGLSPELKTKYVNLHEEEKLEFAVPHNRGQ